MLAAIAWVGSRNRAEVETGTYLVLGFQPTTLAPLIRGIERQFVRRRPTPGRFQQHSGPWPEGFLHVPVFP